MLRSLSPVWCFAFFLLGTTLSDENNNFCHDSNRLSCRNLIEADRCGLLDNCTDIWKKSPWILFKNDLSSKCMYCSHILEQKLQGSDRSIDAVVNALCMQFSDKNKCIHLIFSFSDLDDYSIMHVGENYSRTSLITKPNDILCNLFSSCNSAVFLGNLNFGNKTLCGDCKRIIEDVRNLLNDNATAVELSSKLKSLLCAPLTDELRHFCEENIDIHVPYILRLLEIHIDSNAICIALNLCPDTPANSFKDLYQKTFSSKGKPPPCPPRTKFSWINPPPSYTGGEYTSEMGALIPDCTQCQNVMNQIKVALDNPDTEDRIANSVINALCHNIPSCASEVRSKIDSTLAMIQNIDARDICAFFGMCTEPAIVIRNQMLMQPAVSIPGVCEVCEVVIVRLVDMVAGNFTMDSITNALDEVCYLTPSSYRSKCISFVESYGAKIVKAMLKGLTPKLICISFGLCHSPVPSPVYQKPSTICPICKEFINLLYDMLLMNHTEEEMKNLLKKKCALLPDLYASKCEELVDEYWDVILKYIEMQWTPEMICKKIGLCPASEESLRTMSCQHASYYCSSLPIAIKCQALDLCQTLGYQSDLFFSSKAQAELNVLDDYCTIRRRIPLKDQLNIGIPIIERLVFNFTICSKFVQRWLLEKHLFGRPVVTESECNVYIEKWSHSQCMLTMGYRNELITASIGNGGNHKKSCQDVLNHPSALELLLMNMRAKPAPKATFQYISSKRSNTTEKQPIRTNEFCQSCEFVMRHLKIQLKDEQFVDVLRQLLTKYVCLESETCVARMNRWVNEIRLLVEALDTRFLCQYFHLCPPYELPLTRQGSNFPGKCQMCEAFVAKLLEMTIGNETESEIVGMMSQVCAALPASFQERCEAFVETFGPKLAESIVRGYGSEVVCELLGLCDSIGKIQLLINTNLPKEVPVSAQSIACETCQSVVAMIYKQLEQNKTKEELINVVKERCNYLPHSIRLECSTLIDLYLGAIVDYFERQYKPRQVCEELAICPASDNKQTAQSGSCLDVSHKCSNLEAALQCNAIYECYSLGLQSNLLRPLKERRTKTMFDNICNTLNRMNDRGMPSRVLQNRVQQFLQLITHHQSEQVFGIHSQYHGECTICPSVFEMWKLHHYILLDMGPRESVCQKFTSSQQQSHCKSIWNTLESTGISALLPNENGLEFCARVLKCGRAPDPLKLIPTTVSSVENCANRSYWCSSMKAAESCQKVFYCKLHGLLQLSVPQSTGRKCVDIFDQDCCSWGSTYYCQSERTAKQCGDRALKHCQVYVWTKTTTTEATVADTAGTGSAQNREKLCARGPIFWCHSRSNANLCGPLVVRFCRNFHAPRPRGS